MNNPFNDIMEYLARLESKLEGVENQLTATRKDLELSEEAKEGLLTAEQAAEYLNASVTFINDRRKSGILAYHGQGKMIRYKREDLRAALGRHRAG